MLITIARTGIDNPLRAGCVLFELLSFNRPFSGCTEFELMSNIVNREPEVPILM